MEDVILNLKKKTFLGLSFIKSGTPGTPEVTLMRRRQCHVFVDVCCVFTDDVTRLF